MENCIKCEHFENLISLMKYSLEILEQQIDSDYNLLSYMTFRGVRNDIIDKHRLQLEQKRNRLRRGNETLAGTYNDYGNHLVYEHED